MSKTLSADVIALGAGYGATIHANLTWNAPARKTRFRITANTTEPAATTPQLIPQLRELLRAGGFPEQRVSFDNPYRFRIDAL